MRRQNIGLFVLYAALLATCALVDAEHQIIPDVIVLPLLWGGLLVNCTGTFVPLQSAVIGAVAGYSSLWGLNLLFQLTAEQAAGSVGLVSSRVTRLNTGSGITTRFFSVVIVILAADQVAGGNDARISLRCRLGDTLGLIGCFPFATLSAALVWASWSTSD